MIGRPGVRGGLLLWMFAALPSPGYSQTMRDFEYSRPKTGERSLRAEIVFAAGKLVLGPAASERLYQLVLEYDADRFQPVGSYDAESGTVKLGVESSGRGGIRVGRKSALPQSALIALAREVDLSLDVSLGAAEGRLELGDYRITDLALQSGASRMTVTFAKPNPAACRSASISSGAGEVTVEQAGNGGCSRWSVDGGVGAVTLDLSGAWPADARLDLSLALGGVTLIAPKELGLRVSLNGFLAGFAGKGFSKSGRTHTSAGYERATRKLDVQVNSAMGGVRVEWR